MIKKIRRKRIVVRKKEVLTVGNRSESAQICPVCRTIFAPQKTLSPIEKKQIASAEIRDEHECS